MALEATYKKEHEGEKAGRRTEKRNDFTRELGMRLGAFEVGYRTVDKGFKITEQTERTKGKVDRAFRIGFT